MASSLSPASSDDNNDENHQTLTNHLSLNIDSTTCVDDQDETRNKNNDEKDLFRSQSEVSAFAAMDNADVDGISPSKIEDQELDRDFIRRQNEMSAFAAMANADVDGMSPNAKDDQESDHDLGRRQSEMSAFAAMANADVDDVIPNANNDQKLLEKDFIRSQSEVSAFAAMANADVNGMSSSKSKDQEFDRDFIRRQNEMSAFAAMANADVHDVSPSKSEDQEFDHDVLRRQNEMSAFAAMANVDVDDVSPSKSEDHEFDHDVLRRQNEMSIFAAMANAGMDSITRDSLSTSSSVGMKGASDLFTSSRLSSLTSNTDTSGTFVSEKQSTASNGSNRNINAALASLQSESTLEKGKEQLHTIKPGIQFDSLKDASQVKQRKPQYSEMYSECVRVAKPMFFSANIPPRVSAELQSQQSKPSNRISDGEDTYSTKILTQNNLECILALFGQQRFSLSNSVSENLKSDKNNPESATENTCSNNFISLYEPVWGDSHRLYREDRIYSKSNEKYKSVDEMHQGGTKNSMKSDRKDNGISSETVDNINKSSKDAFVQELNEKKTDHFLQYARGGYISYNTDSRWENNNLSPVPESNPVNSSTFRHIIANPNGSFEGSELKKQVGVNDNLSKALESLSINTGVGSVSLTDADAGAAAIEAAQTLKVAVKDGRPLTNLEMANGSVPLYGCDDTPLPNPIELGIYETKEDQIGNIQQYEAQEMIASEAVPNIFGSIVCPSNCLGPDDSQSWCSSRSREVESYQRSKHSRTYKNSLKSNHSRGPLTTESFLHNMEDRSELPPPLPPPPHLSKGSFSAARSRGHNSSVSFGTLPAMSVSGHNRMAEWRKNDVQSKRIGWWNISNDLGLKPNNESARKEASDTEDATLGLPSSREEIREDFSWTTYPSPDKLKTENRSFAELHPTVDTIKYLPYLSDRNPLLRHVQIDTQLVGFPSVGEVEPFFCSLALWNIEPSSSTGEFPQISWELCGRITEFLNFDIVSDKEVEESCRSALWPYLPAESLETRTDDSMRGTRCGVFPIHARYKMSNLYAVIILHKTLGEDSELDIYMNGVKTKSDESSNEDISKLRARVGEKADKFGHFLMPFAFGVAPLVQILGSNPPQIPTSRAAQIPLFKLVPGEGDKPIIDHILAAENKIAGAKPAELIKEGSAMLVLRNFGYLGLHSSIHSQSKLACDRLVDFTGDLQVRRRFQKEINPRIDDQNGLIYAIDSWHKDFVGEPTVNGGRSQDQSKGCDVAESNSPFYAQELAPVPLLLEKSISPYSNIYLHTSFCNELILGPRFLHNCNRRNIVIKVEIRHLEFNNKTGRFLATLPVTPMMHNARRGPALVNEAYTSCAYHKYDPQFSEDFKIKLPIQLQNSSGGKLVALFSVYNITVKGRKKWSLISSKGDEDEKINPLELLGCGYLPLCVSDQSSCLIADGLHKVKLKYISKEMPVVMENIEIHEDDASDTTTNPHTLDLEKIGSIESPNENDSPHENGVKCNILDKMILHVRAISYSSVHTQNEALTDFFRSMPNAPNCDLRESPIMISDELDIYENSVSEEEHKLLSTIHNISTSDKCPKHELVAHFLRINMQLWRTLVCGLGQPSQSWANPASLSALRLHSFASLLHIFNSVCLGLNKVGITDLNGGSKWNIVSMSRIVKILFDEDVFFPCPNEMTLDDDNKLEMDTVAVTKDDISNIAIVKSVETAHLDDSQCKSDISFNKNDVPIFDPYPKLVSASKDSFQDNRAKVSQDDITVLDLERKPPPLRTRSSSAPNSKALKIDTKNDFQIALNSSLSPSSGNPVGSISGPAANRRKWLTAPSSSLATIQEDNDKLDERLDVDVINSSTDANEHCDELDSELFKTKTNKVKQMRVPNLTSSNNPDAPLHDDTIMPGPTILNKDDDVEQLSKVVPKTDQEIENAGTAFLDMIGKNFGFGVSKELGGEEKRVGIAHHRKTRSRCSIDWSLPSTDLLIENYQEMEIFNRKELSTQEPDLQSSRDVTITKPSTSLNPSSEQPLATPILAKDTVKGNKTTPKSQETEQNRMGKSVILPSFKERNNRLKTKNTGRWFPYAYEVIIFQWAAILSQQTKRQLKSMKVTNFQNRDYQENAKTLKDVAYKAGGVAISCAPILFEIIKKSLGYRVHKLLVSPQKHFEEKEVLNKGRLGLGIHPTVVLDSSIISTLEDLICIVTDACLDNRNFDSWSFRYTSIVVNDSIARFLRDLFAFIDAETAHRLILVYFQRFVSKDGKHWHDRDSKIGLRCSWEICKLRLNSITLFIRFADFVKVNKPLMESWGQWSLGAPNRSTRSLFSTALEDLERLEMSSFVLDGPVSNETVEIPKFKSHWLVELVIEICLSATGHVEQNIQHRAAALLYELFWNTSLEGKCNGSLTVLTSMFIPFITKILSHISFLSNLSPKSQLRKDLLTCVVFVMQSAPFGLLRTLWRKLCIATKGCDIDKYGGLMSDLSNKGNTDPPSLQFDTQSILDICSLLNISLKTFEYEGSESNIEEEVGGTSDERSNQWRREFILAVEGDNSGATQKKDSFEKMFTSTSSRKWFSHDGAIVIINACRNIVREYLCILQPKEDYGSISGPIAHHSHSSAASNDGFTSCKKSSKNENKEDHQFSYSEKVTFARAISSVYLNCLSLRQSDIVFIKTLIASIEILKVFGIELFLAAVGETLQHWMRVVLVHCGARRAKVRVEASDFLALFLRLCFNAYGSFYRVRVPLLAVQTEVMERIVATAAARYYREQRRLNLPVQYLSNECAEAALTPLWRTLHRLHHSSASNNAAFKSALEMLAFRMKTLYKAYIAAHALAIVTRSTLSPKSSTKKTMYNVDRFNNFEVKRVVMESAGFSKTILGCNGLSAYNDPVIHNEAVEDTFLAAANVFAPTELPLHRTAWLRKLADFQCTSHKFAEEGACRLEIHKNLQQAAQLHDHLWSSIPFWPWASDSSDGVHLKGEGPASSNPVWDISNECEEYSTSSYIADDANSGRHIEENQSFRRIFYRVANSVRMRTGDWDVGGNKTLFFGATFPSEFNGIPPWISLREIEEDMVEEAEAAGELFLQAGLVESSRYCWSMATHFYSEMFNYAKLSYCYRKLAHVVASKIPVLDTRQLEFSSSLGQFYRVHFHGGAADELMGKEFVYRAAVSVKLEEFCDGLRNILTSILPEKTPMNLVLDDGRPRNEMRQQQRRACAVPREAITIKVTPLKPLLRLPYPRGASEWFHRQTEIAILSPQKQSKLRYANPVLGEIKHRYDSMSMSRFRSSASTSSLQPQNRFGRPSVGNESMGVFENTEHETKGGGVVVGAKKFSFTQSRDRSKPGRDIILKVQGKGVFEKSLRVTELLVGQSLPTCVTRQAVIQRSVFKHSPLEAGVEEVCSWCAVLFRTSVATNGLAVIGTKNEPGIGVRAERVIGACIHKSRVKELGRNMLKGNDNSSSKDDVLHSARSQDERLSAEEIETNQKKLARAIVMLMELLHVLVSRNRDLLLTALDIRKRRDMSVAESFSERGNMTIPPSPGSSDLHGRGFDDGSMGFGGASASSMLDRTDKAMAIQRELQKAFIAMIKVLQPILVSTIHSECPRWMRLCCHDSYFSSGSYRQAKIALGEELLFFGNNTDGHSPHDGASQVNDSFFVPLSILPTQSDSSQSSSYDEGNSGSFRSGI